MHVWIADAVPFPMAEQWSARAPAAGCASTDTMSRPRALRPLTADEVQQLKAGLRSPKAFTVRRCQILLASARGQRPGQLAAIIGCRRATVSTVIGDFHARGVACVHEERRRPGARRRGCPRVEEKEPAIVTALEGLLTDE